MTELPWTVERERRGLKWGWGGGSWSVAHLVVSVRCAAVEPAPLAHRWGGLLGASATPALPRSRQQVTGCLGEVFQVFSMTCSSSDVDRHPAGDNVFKCSGCLLWLIQVTSTGSRLVMGCFSKFPGVYDLLNKWRRQVAGLCRGVYVKCSRCLLWVPLQVTTGSWLLTRPALPEKFFFFFFFHFFHFFIFHFFHFATPVSFDDTYSGLATRYSNDVVIIIETNTETKVNGSLMSIKLFKQINLFWIR